MLFLATKIGDLTINDLLFGFVVAAVAMVLISGVCLAFVKKKEAEDRAMPFEGKIAKLIDLDNSNEFVRWATFEARDGERVRLQCENDRPYLIGDEGYLKWQGTRLLSFDIGSMEDNNEMWYCASCGTANRREIKACQRCGVSKQWSVAQYEK